MNFSLQLMSYNIKYDSAEENEGWSERRKLVGKIIKQQNPDLIGMQECLYHQITDLQEMLSGYSWIGFGREGGSKGEFTPIFYKKKRFRVIEYDHVWLSDTPNKIASKTWGNIVPRIVTWVLFLDKDTKKTFYQINTHFDNHSALARVKSAELINKIINDFNPQFPILLSGDFNVGCNSEIYSYFTKEGSFVDVWDTAIKTENSSLGSFNDFHNLTGGKDRIDWILMKAKANVNFVKLVNDTVNNQFPSDHFPVVTSLYYMD
ncbi:endonuclease/exonuclease/phosphatase family protein [Virgibacillus necropolis]|uniref:Endonuclease n=1 Tax=Virgibacillus necropolis TaxID=163877 RepID=A0A221M9L0_9BACI|nr:endonuclease/exonuclease/phosphatase family protein [Virgibacillus necropolis]ASN04327.1 endonuclease [Virgibacillus necropolis]